MNIHLCRENQQIEVATLKKIGEHISRIIGAECYIEDNIISASSITQLQSMVDKSLEEKRQPLIFVLYTNHNIKEESATLGLAFIRVAIVKHENTQVKKMVLTTLHEIGHLCDARHCQNPACLMYFQHQPLPIDNSTFSELLCSRCFAIVSHSWVYRLITTRR